MLGFSIYLNEDWSVEKEDFINDMASIGFKGIFTSLHLPEDDASKYGERLAPLLSAAKHNGLKLMIDISGDALHQIGLSIREPEQIVESGISGLRLDDGFELKDTARLSNYLTVALNASTLTKKEFEQLERYHANFGRMEAWHNYYPRPETGLEEKWFGEKNEWLKSNGFAVAAFAPGDGKLRHPLFETLPTLEIHRCQNPLASSLSLLQDYGVNHVYLGDPGLSPHSRRQFIEYLNNRTILLHAATADAKWHDYMFKDHVNRVDVAKDVIRSERSRRHNRDANILPENNRLRRKGSITLDNYLYGRYKGELQITKLELPADEKVNVIGQIVEHDLPLLEFIRAGTKFKITDRAGGK